MCSAADTGAKFNQRSTCTTEREVDELEAAINRATTHGIEVVANGERKRDGAADYAVPSRSQTGVFGEPAPVREEKPYELAARHQSAVLARSSAPFSLFKKCAVGQSTEGAVSIAPSVRRRGHTTP
jgi:hypothetical protein